MRGIVIPAGMIYYAGAYVTVRMLRHVGCTLPVEIWGLNPDENPGWHRRALDQYGVTFRCAESQQRQTGSCRIVGGFELKPYAMLHSAFDQVLLLDSDCYPVRDPAFLFDHGEYRRTGAVFWPDWRDRDVQAGTWTAMGLRDPSSRPVESGAILIDKTRRLGELRLANWLNQHSDFYYKFSRGDKDLLRVAWHHYGSEYAMPDHEPVSEWPAMIQPDFAGNPLFVHRMNGKFTTRPTRFTTTVQGQQRNDTLPMEAEAWGFLRDLQRYHDPADAPTITPGEPVAVVQLGRAGDIVSLLPAMRWLSERCPVTHIVHQRYADVTAGLPWCSQFVWDGDPVDPFGAIDEYHRQHPDVRVLNTMVGNNDPHPIPLDKTFAHVQWERTGCPLDLFDQLPTRLDNRQLGAESEVVLRHSDGRPLILFNATHFNPASRPGGFRHGPELLAMLRERLPDHQVLDLGQVRAPRFQDLLGLYERASRGGLLISTDTGTLHLGNVTHTPTIGLVLDDSYRRAPWHPHWIAQFTYGWASKRMADVVDEAESFLKGKPCDELELCC